MLAEFVLWVLPCRPISGEADHERKSCLFGLLFESLIVRFDGNTVGAPVSSILILVTAEEDDCFLLLGHHGIKNFLEFAEGNNVSHAGTDSS